MSDAINDAINDAVTDVMSDTMSDTMSDALPDKTISRRQFVSGMVGAGLFIAGSGLILSACSNVSGDAKLFEELTAAFPQANITFLTVEDSQIIHGYNFTNTPPENYFLETRSFNVPLGSLIFQASDQIACVLTPGAESRILTRLALLDLTSGELTTLLDRARNDAKDFCIYDARASSSAITWVESSLSSNDWILYAATLEILLAETPNPDTPGTPGTPETDPTNPDPPAVVPSAQIRMGTPYQLDTGDTISDPPMLCVYGSTVYWTVMPDAYGPASTEDSYLKAATISRSGVSNSRTLYTSHGRFITNPQATDGFITIVPRVDVEEVRYQLTALSVATDEVVAISVLPSSLRVSDCVYMRRNFTFSIEGNYNYAQALRFFGTYEQLSDDSVFYANKPPASPAAIINNCLIIKSTKNVVGFDLANQNSFILDKPNDCADYGDLLVGCGAQNYLVVYTTIIDKTNVENSFGRVRIYRSI